VALGVEPLDDGLIRWYEGREYTGWREGPIPTTYQMLVRGAASG
jgi:hypothetical protein